MINSHKKEKLQRLRFEVITLWLLGVSAVKQKRHQSKLVPYSLPVFSVSKPTAAIRSSQTPPVHQHWLLPGTIHFYTCSNQIQYYWNLFQRSIVLNQ